MAPVVTQAAHSPEREDKAPTEKGTYPHMPPQLRGPRRKDRARGIPRTLASIPMGSESISRRIFLPSVLTPDQEWTEKNSLQAPIT